ncbi:hypothetical protein [Cytobacillus sp. FSL H8-0458]|uniref:hypothetical protein n=1 Tax=Cytobacillus sp. FSL H8-0458 TaxID=2975346 RepID=UPI0030FCB60F
MSNPNWNSLIERGESSKTLVRFEEVTDEDIPRLRYEVSLPGSYKGHAFLEIEADGLPWKESAYEINRLPGQFTVEIPNAPTKVRVKAPAAPDPVPNQVHVRAPAAAGDKSPAIINNDGDGFLRFRNYEIPFSEIQAEVMEDRTLVIYKSFGDNIHHLYVPAPKSKDLANPRFVIVEHYRLSSYFGDYGAGKTVQTFSLWPGEETTLYIRSWRRTEQRQKEASSIFDSFTKEAADDFQTSLESEKSDRNSQKDTNNWKADGEAGLNLGLFKIGGGGGGGGTSESVHETLAKMVSKVATHHASKASSKRDTTISTEIETTEAAEFESITERTVKNVNLSRVLNLVCRELNQEFKTYLSLIDVSIAFVNDRFVYEEYSLSELDQLLDKYLNDSWKGHTPIGANSDPRDYVKDLLWKEINSIADFQGNPKQFIEEVQDLNGRSYWRVIRRSDPEAPHPFYPDGNIPVDGIVINLDIHTLRTDGIIIDSLLGHGIALDNYALGTQQEVLLEKQLANKKTELALKLIESGDFEKVEAFRSIFSCPADQILKQVLDHSCSKEGGTEGLIQ